MRWLAIVNPCAGRNDELGLRRLVNRLRHSFGASCEFTTHPNQTSRIVQDHPEYDGYIAVGGDGTISEVVNGLADYSHVLGIIPAGTSNGLARDLRLDTLAAALRALQQPCFRRMDVIAVRFRQKDATRARKMISTSALGYIAGATDVAYRYKRRLGVVSHFVGAIWQPMRQGEFVMRARFDDEPWQEHAVTSVAVHNTQFIGNFRLFPEAQVDDGLFNVLHGRLSAFGQLVEDLGIFTRTYVLARSAHRQAGRLEIQLARPDTLMVDGDLYPEVDAIQYEVEPARVTCCAAESAAPKSDQAHDRRPVMRLARAYSMTPLESGGNGPVERRRAKSK